MAVDSARSSLVNFAKYTTQIAMGSVSKSATFWRTFTKSSWVLAWIEKGFELQWIDGAQPPKIAKKSPSSLAQESFVTSMVDEMLAAGAISILPKGERPEVVSPLGVVPKGTEGKLRLIINMRYVNEYMVKKKFKLQEVEGLVRLGREGGPRSLL